MTTTETQTFTERDFSLNPVEVQPGQLVVTSDAGSDVYLQQIEMTPTELLVADNGSFLDYMAVENFEDRFEEFIVTNGAQHIYAEDESITADMWWLFPTVGEEGTVAPAEDLTSTENLTTTKLALRRDAINIGPTTANSSDFYGEIYYKQSDGVVSKWTYTAWNGSGGSGDDFRKVTQPFIDGTFRNVTAGQGAKQPFRISSGPGFGGGPISYVNTLIAKEESLPAGYVFPKNVWLRAEQLPENRQDYNGNAKTFGGVRFYLEVEWSQVPVSPPLMTANYYGDTWNNGPNGPTTIVPESRIHPSFGEGAFFEQPYQPTFGVAMRTKELRVTIPRAVTEGSPDGAASFGIIPGTLRADLVIGGDGMENVFTVPFSDRKDRQDLSNSADATDEELEELLLNQYKFFFPFTDNDGQILTRRRFGLIASEIEPNIVKDIDYLFTERADETHTYVEGKIEDGSDLVFQIGSHIDANGGLDELDNLYELNELNDAFRALDGVNVEVSLKNIEDGTAINAVRVENLDYHVYVKPTIANSVYFVAGADITRTVTVDLLKEGSSIYINSPIRVTDQILDSNGDPAGDIDLRATNIIVNAPLEAPDYLLVGRSESENSARLPRVTDPQGGELSTPTFTGSHLATESTTQIVSPTPVIKGTAIDELLVLPGREGYGYDPANPPALEIAFADTELATVGVKSVAGGVGELILLATGSGYQGYPVGGNTPVVDGPQYLELTFTDPQLRSVESIDRWEWIEDDVTGIDTRVPPPEGYTAAPVIAISKPEVVIDATRVGYGVGATVVPDNQVGNGIQGTSVAGGTAPVTLEIKESVAEDFDDPAQYPRPFLSDGITPNPAHPPALGGLYYPGSRGLNAYVVALELSDDAEKEGHEFWDPNVPPEYRTYPEFNFNWSINLIPITEQRRVGNTTVTVQVGWEYVSVRIPSIEIINVGFGLNISTKAEDALEQLLKYYKISVKDSNSSTNTAGFDDIAAGLGGTWNYQGYDVWESDAVRRPPDRSWYHAGMGFLNEPELPFLGTLAWKGNSSNDLVNSNFDATFRRLFNTDREQEIYIADYGSGRTNVDGLQDIGANYEYSPDVQFIGRLEASVAKEYGTDDDYDGNTGISGDARDGDVVVSRVGVVPANDAVFPGAREGAPIFKASVRDVLAFADSTDRIQMAKGKFRDIDYLSLLNSRDDTKTPITATASVDGQNWFRVQPYRTDQVTNFYAFATWTAGELELTLEVDENFQPFDKWQFLKQGMRVEVQGLVFELVQWYQSTGKLILKDANEGSSNPVVLPVGGSQKQQIRFGADVVYVDEQTQQFSFTNYQYGGGVEPKPGSKDFDSTQLGLVVDPAEIAGQLENIQYVKLFYDREFEVSVVTQEMKAYATMGYDPARGRAVVSEGGEITNLEVTYAGSGYIDSPLVSFGGTGNGAAAIAVVSGGIYELEIETSGFNYYGTTRPGFGSDVLLETPIPVFDTEDLPQGASNPVADFISRNSAVSGGQVTNPGSGLKIINNDLQGFQKSEIELIPGPAPGQQNAVFEAIVEPDGRILNFRRIRGGEGYQAAPKVVIDSPLPPASATAVAHLNSQFGQVAAVEVVEPGHRYDVTPKVYIYPPTPRGEGRAATGVAVLGPSGEVLRIDITDPGRGYTSPPIVEVQKVDAYNLTEYVDIAANVEALKYELYVSRNTWTPREKGLLRVRTQQALANGVTDPNGVGEDKWDASEWIYIEASAADLLFEGDVDAESFTVLMNSREADRAFGPYEFTTISSATNQSSGTIYAERLVVTLGNDTTTPLAGGALTNRVDLDVAIDNLRITAAESATNPRGAFPYDITIRESLLPNQPAQALRDEEVLVEAVARSGGAITLNIPVLTVGASLLTDGDLNISTRNFTQTTPLESKYGRINITAQENISVTNSILVTSADIDPDVDDITLFAQNGFLALEGLIQSPNGVYLRQSGGYNSVADSYGTLGGNARVVTPRLRVHADGDVSLYTNVNTFSAEVDYGSLRVGEDDDVNMTSLQVSNGPIHIEANGVDRGARGVNPIAMTARIVAGDELYVSAPNGSIDVIVDSSSPLSLGVGDQLNSLVGSGDEAAFQDAAMFAAGSVRIINSSGDITIYDAPTAGQTAAVVKAASTEQLADVLPGGYGYTYEGNTPGEFPSTLSGAGKLPLEKLFGGVKEGELEVGDYVLLKNQIDNQATPGRDETRENGIYRIERLGGGHYGFADWLLRRAETADDRNDLEAGSFVRIEFGEHAGEVYQLFHEEMPELNVMRTMNSQLVVQGGVGDLLSVDINDVVEGEGILPGARVTAIDYVNGVVSLGIGNMHKISLVSGDDQSGYTFRFVGDAASILAEIERVFQSQAVLVTGDWFEVGAKVIRVDPADQTFSVEASSFREHSEPTAVSDVVIGFATTASGRVGLNPAVRTFMMNAVEESTVLEARVTSPAITRGSDAGGVRRPGYWYSSAAGDIATATVGFYSFLVDAEALKGWPVAFGDDVLYRIQNGLKVVDHINSVVGVTYGTETPYDTVPVGMVQIRVAEEIRIQSDGSNSPVFYFRDRQRLVPEFSDIDVIQGLSLAVVDGSGVSFKGEAIASWDSGRYRLTGDVNVGGEWDEYRGSGYGEEYDTVPVTFSQPESEFGRVITGFAVVNESGGIGEIVVTDQGSGYQMTSPVFATLGREPGGASPVRAGQDGVIEMYWKPDALWSIGVSGSIETNDWEAVKAVATATVVETGLSYTSNVDAIIGVEFSEPDYGWGTQLQGYAVPNGFGGIAQVVITAGGDGYASRPLITIDPPVDENGVPEPGGKRAIATLDLTYELAFDKGFDSNLGNYTSEDLDGWGYTTDPTQQIAVTFSPPGFVSAYEIDEDTGGLKVNKVTGELIPSVVTPYSEGVAMEGYGVPDGKGGIEKIVITSPGYGYAEPPQIIRIDPPAAKTVVGYVTVDPNAGVYGGNNESNPLKKIWGITADEYVFSPTHDDSGESLDTAIAVQEIGDLAVYKSDENGDRVNVYNVPGTLVPANIPLSDIEYAFTGGDVLFAYPAVKEELDDRGYSIDINVEDVVDFEVLSGDKRLEDPDLDPEVDPWNADSKWSMNPEWKSPDKFDGEQGKLYVNVSSVDDQNFQKTIILRYREPDTQQWLFVTNASAGEEVYEKKAPDTVVEDGDEKVTLRWQRFYEFAHSAETNPNKIELQVGNGPGGTWEILLDDEVVLTPTSVRETSQEIVAVDAEQEVSLSGRVLAQERTEGTEFDVSRVTIPQGLVAEMSEADGRARTVIFTREEQLTRVGLVTNLPVNGAISGFFTDQIQVGMEVTGDGVPVADKFGRPMKVVVKETAITPDENELDTIVLWNAITKEIIDFSVTSLNLSFKKVEQAEATISEVALQNDGTYTVKVMIADGNSFDFGTPGDSATTVGTTFSLKNTYRRQFSVFGHTAKVSATLELGEANGESVVSILAGSTGRGYTHSVDTEIGVEFSEPDQPDGVRMEGYAKPDGEGGIERIVITRQGTGYTRNPSVSVDFPVPDGGEFSKTPFRAEFTVSLNPSDLAKDAFTAPIDDPTEEGSRPLAVEVSNDISFGEGLDEIDNRIFLGAIFSNYDGLSAGQFVFGDGVRPGTVITKVYPALKAIEVTPGGLPREIVLAGSYDAGSASYFELTQSASEYHSEGFEKFVVLPNSFNEFHAINLGQKVEITTNEGFVIDNAIVTGIDPVYRRVGLEYGDIADRVVSPVVVSNVKSENGTTLIVDVPEDIADSALQDFEFGYSLVSNDGNALPFSWVGVANNPELLQGVRRYTINTPVVDYLIRDVAFRSRAVISPQVEGGSVDLGRLAINSIKFKSLERVDFGVVTSTGSGIADFSVPAFGFSPIRAANPYLAAGDAQQVEDEAAGLLLDRLQVNTVDRESALTSGAYVTGSGLNPGLRIQSFDGRFLSLYSTTLTDETARGSEWAYKVDQEFGDQGIASIKNDSPIVINGVEAKVNNIPVKVVDVDVESGLIVLSGRLSTDYSSIDEGLDVLVGQAFTDKFRNTSVAQTSLLVHAEAPHVATTIAVSNARDTVDYQVSTDGGTAVSAGSLARLMSVAQSNSYHFEAAHPLFEEGSKWGGAGVQPVVQFSSAVTSVELKEPLPLIRTNAIRIDGRYFGDGVAQRVEVTGRFISQTSSGDAILESSVINGIVIEGNDATGTVIENLRLGGFRNGAAIQIDGADDTLIENIVIGRTAEGIRVGSAFGVYVTGDTENTTVLNTEIVSGEQAGVRVDSGAVNTKLVGMTIGRDYGDAFVPNVFWNETGLEAAADSVQLGVSPISWKLFEEDQPTVAMAYAASLVSGSDEISIDMADDRWADLEVGLAVIGLGLPASTFIEKIDVVSKRVKISQPATRTVSTQVLVGHQAIGLKGAKKVNLADSVDYNSLYPGQQVTFLAGTTYSSASKTRIVSVRKTTSGQTQVELADEIASLGLYEQGIRLIEFGDAAANVIRYSRNGVVVGLFGEVSAPKSVGPYGLSASGALPTLNVSQSFTGWDSLRLGMSFKVRTSSDSAAAHSFLSGVITGWDKVNREIEFQTTDFSWESFQLRPIVFDAADKFEMVNTTISDSIENGIVFGGGKDHSVGVRGVEVTTYDTPEQVNSLHPDLDAVELASYRVIASLTATGEMLFSNAEAAEWLASQVDGDGNPMRVINLYGKSLPENSSVANFDPASGEIRVAVNGGSVVNVPNWRMVEDTTIYFGLGAYAGLGVNAIRTGAQVDGPGIYEFTTVEALRIPFSDAANGLGFLALSTPMPGLTDGRLPIPGDTLQFMSRGAGANVLSNNSGYGITVVDAAIGTDGGLEGTLYGEFYRTWGIRGNYIDLSYDTPSARWVLKPNLAGPVSPLLFAKLFGGDEQFSSYDRTDDYGNRYGVVHLPTEGGGENDDPFGEG